MDKKIVVQSELQTQIRESIKNLSDIVGKTLGPGGLPILIERLGLDPAHRPLKPMVTKDGVTVARSVKVKDHTVNSIMQTVIEVAERTNLEVGDGPQPLYSKVLTPTGFVKMEDLKVGMEICGTSGTIQKVEQIFPKGQKEIKEVEFENKGIVECCKDHVWEVLDSYTNEKKIKTTQEMEEDFVKIDSNNQKRYKYYTQNTFVEFYEDSSKIFIDPYLLGVLIGDGCLRESGNIELSLGFSKEHIIDKINLPCGITFNKTYCEDKNYFRIRFVGKDKEGKSLRDYIKDLGLSDATNKTKFIPKTYLYSCKKTREALLQGLLDTDGHINTRGDFEYSTVSPQLADDFIELTRSLGIVTRLHERNGDSYYRITELKGYQNGVKIIRISSTGRYTDMQCIKVSNKDNLYITDGYNVTHNTTSAIVLANEIYNQGLKYITMGERPETVYKEITSQIEKIMSKLDSISIPVDDDKMKKSVATISANNDEEIGTIVGQAFSEVGEDGVITLREGYSPKTELKLENGFQIDRGLLRPEVFYTHPGKQVCELNNCAIILYDGEIKTIEEILPIMNKITVEFSLSNAFLLIARDIIGSALNTLMVNRMEQRMTNFAMIKAPNVGHIRTQMLQDIAIKTGGKMFIPDGNGDASQLQNAMLDQLGFAKQVILGKYKTHLYDTGGNEQEIITRVEELKEAKQHAESPYDAAIIEDRIASLTGGIAVIEVGGRTELEMKEKKDRIEDALNATRAAIQEGIVPGGGSALFNISTQLKDKTLGATIMSEVLKKPLYQISTNLGEVGELILNKVEMAQRENSYTFGFNGHSKKIENLVEAGVIDPVKVVKTSLSNAISIANLLLTCGGAIVVDNDVKKEGIHDTDNFGV